MSRRMMTLIALALTLTGTSACDEAPEAAFGADGEVALRPGGYSGGGVLLNTSATGEWAIDHLDTTFGSELDGVVLTGITLQGKEKGMEIKLEAVWVKNGQIFGKSQYGEHQGAEFVNSMWSLKTPLATGADQRLMTISQYTVDPNGLHRYVFMYPNDPAYGPHFYNFNIFGQNYYKEQKFDEPGQQNLAVCAPDSENGGSLEALVYGDVYVDMKNGNMSDRPGTINIACISGGVGKAGLWGFLPYEHGIDALQAGTRAVRADFCGDGTSYTKPGNALYMKDIYGIHDFGNAAGNKTEAIWTVKGAACVGVPRDSNFTYADVDCGGWAPIECKDMEMGDIGPEAQMHSKIP